MYDYLYSLNLGPQTLCVFQIVWSELNDLLGIHISLLAGFLNGLWIDPKLDKHSFLLFLLLQLLFGLFGRPGAIVFSEMRLPILEV